MAGNVAYKYMPLGQASDKRKDSSRTESVAGNVAQSPAMASSPMPLSLTPLSQPSRTHHSFCNAAKFPYHHHSNTHSSSNLSIRTCRNLTAPTNSLAANSLSNNSPVVSADDNWGVWTALFATGAFGLW